MIFRRLVIVCMCLAVVGITGACLAGLFELWEIALYSFKLVIIGLVATLVIGAVSIVHKEW